MGEIGKTLFVLCYPFISTKASYSLIVSNMIDLFHDRFHIYLVGGRIPAKFNKPNVDIIEIPFTRGSGIENIIKNSLYQLRACVSIFRSKPLQEDPLIIFSGSMIIATLLGRVKGLRVILAAVAPESNLALRDRSILERSFIRISEKICFAFSSLVTFEGPNVPVFMGLNSAPNFSGDGSLFIVGPDFASYTPHAERRRVISFIGRLSIEKGVEELLVAVRSSPIPRGYKIEILGDGPLKEQVKEVQKENDQISYKGWIDRSDLPSYLNSVQFIIVPSHSEGLPNSMMEAMACGTIPIANRVGAIPDVIKDGENGFIMKGNTPELILQAIERAVSAEQLGNISERSYKTVLNGYGPDSVKDRWARLINGQTASEENG